VRYWQVGNDQWREAEAWPPPHTERRWYLRTGGTLSPEPPAPGDDEPPDTYTYDPADPTPTVGDKTLMPTIMFAGI
jgi:predicted acyl esterase